MLSFMDILRIPLHELAQQKLRPVKVAVLDTGIDASHEALRGRVIRSVGYKRDAGGVLETITLNRTTNNDPSGHGTGVSAVLAALAPNARIIDHRVLDADCGGSGLTVLRGLEEAIDSQAEIINISIAFRKDRYWDATVKLLEKAYERNKIVIASKRNMPLPDDLGLPAELSSCISIDNSVFTHPFELKYLKNAKIEFSAYGTELLTAKTGGGYVRMTGTSLATPVVSAFCTMLRGMNPQLTLFEIKTFLKNSVLMKVPRPEAMENPLETAPAQRLGGQLTSVHRCPHCGHRMVILDAVHQVECPVCGKTSIRKSCYNPMVYVVLLDEVRTVVPSGCCYHGIYHARKVYQATCDILSHYRTLSLEDRKSILCAACMHDAGYRLPSEGHECESVRILREMWPLYGLREDRFGQIERLILSTASTAVCSTLAEKILHDADFYHVGTESYWEAAALLRQERANFGEQANEEDWLKRELAFLSAQRFELAWLEHERAPVRTRHIREISRRLRKCVRNNTANTPT